MRLSIVPAQIFLPKDSVKLGRFITSVEYPHQNYHDPPSTSQPRVLISLRGSYNGEHQSASKSTFASTLTSLLSAGFSKREKMKICVTTEHVKTYTLDNSDGWFEEVTRLQVTRAWLERAIDRGHNIYMIVGFHTFTDANIRQESVVGKSVGGHISVPTSLSLTAAGVVALPGAVVDPKVALRQQFLDGAQSQFVVDGEQVCALEYRKVTHGRTTARGDKVPFLRDLGPSLPSSENHR
ncbi:hypothetical protein C7999DRAFT_33356 [Corynascus novoguineensis]|uniref:Uncharacterized protein n=1 Tax=Corynascus novoguineensis TaxID=1126955 RepID=A0AAN7CQ11_9PEZI|nr:hypothetical protein C7999DRAFT_33356 [Corynascus novoguineensis]